MYDSKVNLKENYDEFWDTNIDMFMREQQRLERNGFTNNLKVAIFRSIKYYHIKKLKKSSEEVSQENSLEKSTKTRDYIKLNKFIIQFIDMFIMNSLKLKQFKPSINYDNIMKNEDFINLLKDEKPKILNKYKTYLGNRMITFNEEQENEWETWWQCKIKKTHKNRYYCLMKNVKKVT